MTICNRTVIIKNVIVVYCHTVCMREYFETPYICRAGFCSYKEYQVDYESHYAVNNWNNACLLH